MRKITPEKLFLKNQNCQKSEMISLGHDVNDHVYLVTIHLSFCIRI